MIQIFKYQGNNVSFEKNGGIMINATQMAKPFGKQPKDWIRLQSSKEFIQALMATRQISLPEKILKVINGGNNPGTWMHEDVAMEFARWINPIFAIWCNDRIKELMKFGATALNPESLLDPDYVIQVMTALKEERQARQLAETIVEQQKPKVLFADSVSGSNNLILISDLAKILKQNGIKIGQNRLFIWMRENGYLLSKGGYYNRPSQKAMEMGLFEVIERPILSPKGTEIISFTTKVTGKGQTYFINKFLKQTA